MSLTALIPAPYRWLMLVLLAGALIAFGWIKGEAHGEAKLTAYELAQSQAAVKAQAVAADITRAQQQRKDDALRQANDRAQRAEASAASARAAGDSLRRDLTDSGIVSRASIASLRAYTTTLRAVFGECTKRLEELGREADGHASDSLMYQTAWPK